MQHITTANMLSGVLTMQPDTEKTIPQTNFSVPPTDMKIFVLVIVE